MVENRPLAALRVRISKEAGTFEYTFESGVVHQLVFHLLPFVPVPSWLVSLPRWLFVSPPSCGSKIFFFFLFFFSHTVVRQVLMSVLAASV